jgi:hypothetical protein
VPLIGLIIVLSLRQLARRFPEEELYMSDAVEQLKEIKTLKSGIKEVSCKLVE